MKRIFAVALLAIPLLASCAHPLERVVEERRQQRIHEAYDGKPITYGSGDGLGNYIARSVDGGLSVEGKEEASGK